MTDPRKPESEIPRPLVETAWLADHVGDPDLRVLDCSVVMESKPDGTYSFTSGKPVWESGHIPGSQFVDVLGELSDSNQAIPMMMPPMEEFARLMGDHGVGDGTRVVLYDSLNHAWAARVWWMLRVCGFDDAAVLNGGFKKWVAEGRETTTERSSYPKAQFTVKPQPELMVTKQQVLNALNDKNIAIINALSPDSHSGKAQNYARPGRIPGSKNVFCQFLVDPEMQTYIAPEALRALFEKTGALEADRVITYCGGGIAASSDALALTLLGLKNVAVYDGSLMEWTADPEMPMETS